MYSLSIITKFVMSLWHTNTSLLTKRVGVYLAALWRDLLSQGSAI
jgi:hypothetical protein